jgi:hypothetical protein
MRHAFFLRFGAGQPEALTGREEQYRLGMPNSSGEAFPPLVNMEDKLDELEAEREWLLDMRPKDKVSTYEEGKETFLVRTIIRYLPKEYDAAIKEVRSLVRIRKAGDAGTMSTISNLEDISRINYSEDWLPPYDELRQELVTTWKQYEKRRKEQGKHPRGGVTSMPILDGHAQPGPGMKRCYGCGALGHVRGDPKCTAGSTAVWKGAPEGFKRKIDGGTKNPNPQRKGGKGKGGATQRNLGKRKADGDTSKLPCHNWARGNGFCKYADNCRYSHSGPKGGWKEHGFSDNCKEREETESSESLSGRDKPRRRRNQTPWKEKAKVILG